MKTRRGLILGVIVALGHIAAFAQLTDYIRFNAVALSTFIAPLVFALLVIVSRDYTWKPRFRVRRSDRSVGNYPRATSAVPPAAPDWTYTT